MLQDVGLCAGLMNAEAKFTWSERITAAGGGAGAGAGAGSAAGGGAGAGSFQGPASQHHVTFRRTNIPVLGKGCVSL